MKKILYLLMVGLAFTLIQVSTAVANDCSAFTLGTPSYISCAAQGAGPVNAGDTTGHSPVDISHCADMPPTTRPACEAQAHSGPPLNVDGTPMAPPADCGGVPCPTGHDGGPDGHHPPADCGGVPCPTGHDGGPDGHHPPADCGGVPCPTGHDGGPDGHHPPADCGGVPCPTGHDGGPDGHHDGPPIDPRTISDANPQGTPFTAADEAKYQVYADECEASGGTISPASLSILIGDGFTTEQVNGLCQMSADDAAKDAACMPGTDGSVPPHCVAPATTGDSASESEWVPSNFCSSGYISRVTDQCQE